MSRGLLTTLLRNLGFITILYFDEVRPVFTLLFEIFVAVGELLLG